MDTTDYKGPSNLGVTRWNAQVEQYYKNTTGKPSYRPKMTPDITGRYVLARDYAALSAEIERLQAALLPFAEAADECDEYDWDDGNQAPVTAGECRAARYALERRP